MGSGVGGGDGGGRCWGVGYGWVVGGSCRV